MTIDEKIEQAAREHSINPITQLDYVLGANFLKSEMLADMQKLAKALEKAIQYGEFAEWAIEENESLQKLDVDARQALAEFKQKYQGEK